MNHTRKKHLVGIGKARSKFIIEMIILAPGDFLSDARQRFMALFVAIGRNLDREEFVKGFEKCVA
jgi:hypothetical protein